MGCKIESDIQHVNWDLGKLRSDSLAQGGASSLGFGECGLGGLGQGIGGQCGLGGADAMGLYGAQGLGGAQVCGGLQSVLQGVQGSQGQNAYYNKLLQALQARDPQESFESSGADGSHVINNYITYNNLIA